MHKPSILLISFVFSPNIGGVESHLDDLCAYLTKKGYKIVVITYQPLISKGTAFIHESNNNFTIIRIPWFKFNLFNRLEKFPILEFLYLTPAILIFSYLYILLNTKKIDVIQTHGFNMAFVGAVLSVIFRKKFIVNTHVSFNFTKGTMYANILKTVLNQAEKILVLTSQAKEELLKIGVEERKIIIYHQWIDEKLFRPLDRFKSRKRLKLEKDSFIVLFIGRLIAAKGVNPLLKVAEKVNKNTKFVFVGSGPLKEVIQNAQSMHSSVHFVGTIDKSEIPYYYSSADVCIIPSMQATQTYAEGIPRVLIESYSCGTPIIATKTGGVKEHVNKNIGFFVLSHEKEIVSLINKLSAKKKLLSSMRRNCIKYAKEQFTLDKNARIIENSLL